MANDGQFFTWDDLKTLDSASYTKDYFEYTMNMNGIYKRTDIDLYNKIYRFGKFDPYNALQDTKEYIFFTKPDLHIMDGKSGNLNPELENQPFFIELANKYPRVISQLQKSADITSNPLSLLLSNSVISNLEVPSLQSTTIDLPVNVFGTAYEYRGSSEASDDNFDFSLEFRDTKYLDVYQYFRAYEEYETLKSHGIVSPEMKYIVNKIIHDQIGIYKIMVDNDMETIIYYAYFCGVMFKSLPRDAFSNSTFTEGLSYNIDMKAAFVEDMNPLILRDFNYLTQSYRETNTTEDLPVYDNMYGGVSGKTAICPYITEKKDITGRKRYALKWRA